jgi:hypothetical protein
VTRRATLAAVGAIVALVALVAALVALVPQAGAFDGEEPLNAKVKPDAVLAPGQTVTFENTTPMPGATSLYSPEACRGHPGTAEDAGAQLTCKAYRIVLKLDKNPDALNTVFFEADFDQVKPPQLVAGVGGVNPAPLNGINVYVWDWEDHYLGQDAPDPTFDPVLGPGDPNDIPPGGNSFAAPERGGFTAQYAIYDITMQATQGVNQGFKLRVKFSNEIFDKPFELLEDLSSGAGVPTAAEGVFTSPVDRSANIDTGLPTASVLPDNDIANIGLGVNERFDDQALALGRSTRNVAAISEPSPLALVAALVGLPGATGAIILFVLRRRREALLAS